MPFSVQEIQTSRFNVKGEECQAPIPFADILSTNIEPLHCNSSTSDVYLPASGIQILHASVYADDPKGTEQ